MITALIGAAFLALGIYAKDGLGIGLGMVLLMTAAGMAVL